MIFKHTWPLILTGQKTQARFLRHAGWHLTGSTLLEWIQSKYDYRCKWQVGLDYAVQQSPTKPAIARIKLLDIREQRLQHISDSDAYEELGDPGHWCAEFASVDFHVYIEPFVEEFNVALFKWLWNSIHAKAPNRWGDNPHVVALTFELVGHDHN